MKKLTKQEVLNDYRIAHESRQASLLGRREVLTGKGKFGIFGDGKEIPQLALAKMFHEGDWRSGYYRDQTWMLASEILSLEEIFSQIYGDTDSDFNPMNAGRLMNNHFATRSLDTNGNWLELSKQKNSSGDISPTAGQMPRLLGLALASKMYRTISELKTHTQFSQGGNEVAFGSIGDASTSEGHFWETLNAAGVMQVPMAISVWDDGYGISVPNKFQTTKQSISEILSGFRMNEKGEGIHIFTAPGWDYPALCEMYKKGIDICRTQHVPVLFHITQLTQPQGHSTSGSHERYKSAERLQWEKDFDCITKMREWILNEKIAPEEDVDLIEKQAIERVKQARNKAWENYQKPLLQKRDDFLRIANTSNCNCVQTKQILEIKDELKIISNPNRKDILSAARKVLRFLCNSCVNPKNSLRTNLSAWYDREMAEGSNCYQTHLYSHSDQSALKISEVKPIYNTQSKSVPGREILRENWDYILKNNSTVCIFGEDVGKIGGVNQTYEGLQEKYGETRIFDTGIREATIIGQGIGLAMRGLRPIAEIQYFDYLLYGLQLMSDDLATLQYRTNGGQKAPMIINTRGHRLEGIWHSGSPLSMVLNSIRGIYVLVPRDMTRAAGFYNTLLQSDEPALVIEPLNGYRLREEMPQNIGEFSIPIGVPEILTQGTDVTLVTYGSCVRIAEDAVKQLADFNISVELIDVQSLEPFDIHQIIVESLKKTSKIVFFDEDVPGGATAYMMQKVLEEHNGYYHLDAKPQTITSGAHRTPYGTDGDYFSNPNAESVFDCIYSLMHESNPKKYLKIF